MSKSSHSTLRCAFPTVKNATGSSTQTTVAGPDSLILTAARCSHNKNRRASFWDRRESIRRSVPDTSFFPPPTRLASPKKTNDRTCFSFSRCNWTRPLRPPPEGPDFSAQWDDSVLSRDAFEIRHACPSYTLLAFDATGQPLPWPSTWGP